MANTTDPADEEQEHREDDDRHQVTDEDVVGWMRALVDEVQEDHDQRQRAGEQGAGAGEFRVRTSEHVTDSFVTHQ
jgi:hypothetical protein